MSPPVPPGAGDVDRRRLMGAGVAAATGARAGTAPADTAAAATRLALLVGCYDEAGPGRVLPAVRTAAAGTAAARETAAPRTRGDFDVLLARFGIVEAIALGDLGYYARSHTAAQRAARRAGERGDAETVGHGFTLSAAALRDTGRRGEALDDARRAAAAARGLPAEVGAHLDAAATAARAGDSDGVLAALDAARAAHRRLPATSWGSPAGPALGTCHPGLVACLAGRALARVGLYDEAAPVLADAQAHLAGVRTGSAGADVRLSLALVAAGRRRFDEARRLAAGVVEAEGFRPSAWVARRVGELAALADAAGAAGFADLAGRTRAWTRPAGAGGGDA